jgi:2-polyprenyl-3-methyl-5-hydroxy-6-metoxy-1,4-benzoquinol methylase
MTFYSENYKEVDETFYFNMFFSKGEYILDLGCATGNFLSVDPERITGMDSDIDCINICNEKGLKVYYSDLNHRLLIKDERYDAVNCRYIIEHLEKPLDILKECYRVLRPGGLIVVITDKPSYEFWNDHTHKRPYTKIAVRKLLADAGFRIISQGNYHRRGFPGITILLKFLPMKILKMIYLRTPGDISVTEAVKESDGRRQTGDG